MKARIQTIIFVVVAVVYCVIVVLTFGIAHEINTESDTLRHLYFLKYCEAEVLRKVCTATMKNCLDEVPKISDHLIQIKKAQRNK